MKSCKKFIIGAILFLSFISLLYFIFGTKGALEDDNEVHVSIIIDSNIPTENPPNEKILPKEDKNKPNTTENNNNITTTPPIEKPPSKPKPKPKPITKTKVVIDNPKFSKCHLHTVVTRVKNLNDVKVHWSCGLESILNAYPDCDVYVHIYEPSDKEHKFGKGKHFPFHDHPRIDNLKLVWSDFSEFFEDSIFWDLYKRKFWKKYKRTWYIIFSNAARLLMLKKYPGGVYFDLDVIFWKNVFDIYDVEKEDVFFEQKVCDKTTTNCFNNGFLFFNGNDPFILDWLIKNTKKAADRGKCESTWGTCGNLVFTALWKNNNFLKEYERHKVEVHKKKGYNVKFIDRKKNSMYPLIYPELEILITERNSTNGDKYYKRVFEDNIGFHCWNHIVSEKKRTIEWTRKNKEGQKETWKLSKDSLLSHMFREYCPSTYRKKYISYYELG